MQELFRLSIIDFHKDIIARFKERFSIEINSYTTAWKDDKIRHLEITEEPQIIFYNPNYQKFTGATAHSEDGKRIRRTVKDGAIMIVFAGNCASFHLKNMTGLEFLPIDQSVATMKYDPTLIELYMESPFSKIFSQFGNDILHCTTFTRGLPNERTSHLDAQKSGGQLLAIHSQAMKPVALYYKDPGAQGFYLFLPDFGIRAPEIAEMLIQEILPDVAPHMFYDDKGLWLNDDKYYVPSLKKIIEKRIFLVDKQNEELKEIDSQIAAIKHAEQETLNKLLTTKDEPLKNAVAEICTYLGWHVVDVDSYMAERRLAKEEDLWLFDKRIFDVEKDPFILVETTGDIKRSASDDDCIKVLKYRSRRINKLDHKNIKGLLVYNHYYGIPAHERKPPFSKKQIEDAERDRYALISTYELFKLILAEKEKRISKEYIRETILATVGEVTYESVVERHKDAARDHSA